MGIVVYQGEKGLGFGGRGEEREREREREREGGYMREGIKFFLEKKPGSKGVSSYC